ncbi:hypothetical protein H6P81_012410 [Aristolochia fimbriata]|uniref:CCHC-type domain-containing protein n=1 Tax=Aristolochia fimbriata TaxID=158543 RepID=A0AAV7EEZ5_ARIFI|nr:hypothetical protein H6P81_012410 [Aristolochia fimbriata]
MQISSTPVQISVKNPCKRKYDKDKRLAEVAGGATQGKKNLPRVTGSTSVHATQDTCQFLLPFSRFTIYYWHLHYTILIHMTYFYILLAWNIRGIRSYTVGNALSLVLYCHPNLLNFSETKVADPLTTLMHMFQPHYLNSFFILSQGLSGAFRLSLPSHRYLFIFYVFPPDCSRWSRGLCEIDSIVKGNHGLWALVRDFNSSFATWEKQSAVIASYAPSSSFKNFITNGSWKEVPFCIILGVTIDLFQKGSQLDLDHLILLITIKPGLGSLAPIKGRGIRLIDEQAKIEKKRSRVKRGRSAGSSLKSRVKYAAKLFGGEQQPRGSLGKVKECWSRRGVVTHIYYNTRQETGPTSGIRAILYFVYRVIHDMVMEPQKEVVQAVKPPILDDTNFPYWKTRMRAFIKALDEKAWKSVLIGWTPPMITNAASDTSIKPEVDWTAAEDKISNKNAKALNVIFYGVDQERFKLISTCESAKDAWEILSTTYEGTVGVRLSKLQLLNHKFENLQMEEDETIAEYDARIRDIANERFTLGRKIPEAEQVQKVLCSLTEKFAVKVAAIEECKDLDTLKYDDLMGSLRSYEMNIEAKKKRKERGEASIALQVSKKARVTTPSTSVTKEELEEKTTLLTRGFNKAFKSFALTSKITRPSVTTPDDCDTELDDDMNEETLEGMYQKMLESWVDVYRMNADLHNQILVLKIEKSTLEATVSELNAQLLTAQDTAKRLLQGKASGDITEIGFDSSMTKSLDRTGIGFHSGMTKSFNPSGKEKSITFKHWKPLCFYCGITGHIRPKCYKLQNELRLLRPGSSSSLRPSPSLFLLHQAAGLIGHPTPMGKNPVHMKAVIYSLSPFQQKVMPGLWKGLPDKIHKKFSENWISASLLLTPLVGTYTYVQWYTEREKLAHSHFKGFL